MEIKLVKAVIKILSFFKIRGCW